MNWIRDLIKTTFNCVWVNIITKKRSRNDFESVIVSATKIRNYILGDPILDWFNKYGEENGFIKDKQQNTYSIYIMERGQQYEDYVLEYLKPKIKNFSFVNIAADNKFINERGIYETLKHIKKGTDIIYQGFLHSDDLQIRGIPDLLVRGDKLREIFDIYPDVELTTVTGNKKYRFMYYVVDIKFSSIYYGKKGTILNRGSAKAYKAQLYMYNKMLENLFFGETEIDSSFRQPYCFLLGRRIVNENLTLDGKDVLASVNLNNENLGEDVQNAVNWIIDLSNNGRDWDVINPHRQEMYPNMKNECDSPWHNSKKILGRIIDDPTRYCGINKRMRVEMMQSNISLQQYMVRIDNDKKRRIIENMQQVNEGHELICNIQNEKKEEIRRLYSDVMNFYVDFEYINGSDLTFDYQTRNHLYMIGMGYEENGRFIYRCFTPRKLTEREEKLNISNWISNMRCIANKQNKSFRVIHWTRAEPSMFEKMKESWRIRGKIEWVDLHSIFRDNQIVCLGMNNFSLKTVAKSFKKLGYIETDWEDDICDGLSANMVIIRGNKSDKEYIDMYDGIDEVKKYNLVDCKTMWELVKFLRNRIN